MIDSYIVVLSHIIILLPLHIISDTHFTKEIKTFKIPVARKL